LGDRTPLDRPVWRRRAIIAYDTTSFLPVAMQPTLT
jgi:hypothetical protein